MYKSFNVPSCRPVGQKTGKIRSTYGSEHTRYKVLVVSPHIKVRVATRRTRQSKVTPPDIFDRRLQRRFQNRPKTHSLVAVFCHLVGGNRARTLMGLVFHANNTEEYFVEVSSSIAYKLLFIVGSNYATPRRFVVVGLMTKQFGSCVGVGLEQSLVFQSNVNRD